MKRIKHIVLLAAFCFTALLFVACPSTTSDNSGTNTNDDDTSGDATVTLSNASKSVSYNAVYIINGESKTYGEGTYASTAEDECVFLVINGGTLTLNDATITKSGDGTAYSSGDYYNFYGCNSAVVVIGEGSSATLNNCKITTAADYANALFATDDGSITIDTLTINTTADGSRGLYATYSGTITAEDVTITTTGAHCAALATDRGGGTVTVTGTNTLSTAGDGSPNIYSTGTINLTGATGTSTGAQAIVVEGKNIVTLTNSTLSGKDSSLGAVMMYQSTSGDAADSDAASSYSSLTLTNSTIRNNSASASCPLFFITNTTAKIYSNGSTYLNASGTALSSTDYFILAVGNTGTKRVWGTAGSNGGKLTYTSSNETITGIVGVDSTDGGSCTITEGSGCTNSTSTTTASAVSVG